LRHKLIRLAGERGIKLDNSSVVANSSIRKIEPSNTNCSFTDDRGAVRKGKVVHVSPIDALIKTPTIPRAGSRIVFSGARRYAADVMRTFEIGFAARFCTPIPAAEFSAALKLSDE
jgi:hypothetical protein